MLFSIGLMVLIMAALMLAFELRTSSVTHGGEIGQVPVLSAAIQVSLLVMVGLWLITQTKLALAFPGWINPLLGVALALITSWLILKIGDLGRRRETQMTAKQSIKQLDDRRWALVEYLQPGKTEANR